MLLIVDIGNSNTVLAVYDGEICLHTWRCVSDRKRTDDEYAVLLQQFLATAELRFADLTAAAVSSTVPALVEKWQRLCRKYLKVEPLVAGVDIRTDMKICVEFPQQLGPDRLVNAVAGRAKYGCPVIVLDLGTATTFDCVSAEGDFLGGVIAPGVAVAAESLGTSTARLPKVEFVRPRKALGTNTVQALQSGIVYGFAGLVDGVVRRLKQEMGGEVKVIATGGLAAGIAEAAETIDVVDPLLTLDGLRILYDLNKDLMEDKNKDKEEK